MEQQEGLKLSDRMSNQKNGLVKDPMIRAWYQPTISVGSKEGRSKTDPKMRIGKAKSAQNEGANLPMPFPHPSTSRHILLRLHAWITSKAP